MTPTIRGSAALRHGALLTIALILSLASLPPATADDLGGGEADLAGGFPEPVSVTPYLSLDRVPQGGTVKLAVEVDIEHPWHVNANEVREDFLFPTELTIDAPDGITVRRIVYPEPVVKTLAISEVPMALYEGTVYLGAEIEVADTVPPGTVTLSGSVSYQACDNEKCIMPLTADFEIPLEVADPHQAIDASHPEIFAGIDFAAGGGGAEAGAAGGTSAASPEGRIENALASGGYLLLFGLVFVGGLALNLTPCVYPMIPITVSYFGGQGGGRSGRTAGLAGLYLLGMAAMYSTLGLLASLTGGLFGAALTNPIVLVTIALVMVALSLSMFGLYEIRAPERLSSLAGGAKQGAAGAFFMGLTVGIVAAPCIGPFVLGLLTFVGKSASPVLGFLLFFTLAVGLGLPFVILAILSGSISRLPSSGMWMEWVRNLFGVILLAMALYFLRPLVPSWIFFVALGILLLASGIIMGFIVQVEGASRFFRGFRRLVGVAGPLAGVACLLVPLGFFTGPQAEGITWEHFDANVLRQAASSGRPVVIDFSAEWCIPCKELDHKTFRQPDVVDASSGFLPLRADLTQAASPQVIELRRTYEIKGVPTLVFIDARGRERKDLRAVGFIDPADFLSRVNRLVDGTS